MSSIYAGEVFSMARQQFDTVADHLDLPSQARERTPLSKLRESGLRPFFVISVSTAVAFMLSLVAAFFLIR